VEAVAMDLWEPYFNSTVAYVPAAAGKIVHDPYHLGQMLGAAVDRVRRAEHRTLMDAGDERLAGTKYVWLYGWENLPETHRERFDQLRGQKLKTGRAWAIKEMFRDFWASPTAEEGQAFFRRWYGWAIRSRLAPVKQVARSFKAHLANILTYFTHRITNAALEGLNPHIPWQKESPGARRGRSRSASSAPIVRRSSASQRRWPSSPANRACPTNRRSSPAPPTSSSRSKTRLLRDLRPRIPEVDGQPRGAAPNGSSA